MKRYPKPNGVVGRSIPDHEIVSLLDGNLPGGAKHHLRSEIK